MRGYYYLFVVALAAFASGCMTAERAIKETEEIGNSLTREYRERIVGNTNGFSIAHPPRSEEYSGAGTNVFVFTLKKALEVAARNSNSFQKEKESLFSTALALDAQRRAYGMTWAGMLGGSADRSDADDSDPVSHATGKTGLSVSKKFTNGATLAASLGFDILRILKGEGDGSIGIDGDISATIPLLRGSGRKIAREALTQAERNMIYAVYDFEAFRQDFAIEIATTYYKLLETTQNVDALRDQLARLRDSNERDKLLFNAGRLSQVELDQTRQELLQNEDSLVNAVKSRQSSLDAFKTQMGLPIDARVEVDIGEMARLSEALGMNLASTNELSRTAPPLPWNETEAIALALTNRYSLIVSRARLEDTRRALEIAKDALRAELSLKAGVSWGQKRPQGGSASDSNGLNISLDNNFPWDKTSERNAYRAAVIALDAAERGLKLAEDSAILMVRNGFRNIQTAWSSCVIQREALQVATSRVESTDLFQQAGRASTRDKLDAEASLLSARNSMAAALVGYRMAGLELIRDLSLLELSEEGLINE